MQKGLLLVILTSLLVGGVAGAQEKKKNSYSIDYSLINILGENSSASIDMLFNKDVEGLKWMHGFSMRKDKGIGYSIGIRTENKKTNFDFLLSGYGKSENSNEKQAELDLAGRIKIKSKLFKDVNLSAGIGYCEDMEYYLGTGISLNF